MADIDKQRQALIDMIMKAITRNSDEAEGMQTIDINSINICDVDYMDYDEPSMTADDIINMLHLNDPNVIPGIHSYEPEGNVTKPSGLQTDPNGNGNPDNSQGDNSSFSLNPTEASPGEPSGPAADVTTLGKNPSDEDRERYNETPHGTVNDRDPYDFDKIKIPETADISAIADAIIADKNFGLNRAIVEFSTPSIQDPNGVDFKLNIKPGQQLTQDTIIGTVTQNGVTKEIRSVFGSGTVMEDENGGFYRLYKGAGAKRHFIIEDFTKSGEAPEITTEVIDEMTNKFKKEAYLKQFIGDNLCESVLPYILLNRYEEYVYRFTFGGGSEIDYRENGREIYGHYMDIVNDIRNQYVEDMKNIGTEENVRKTNGNMRKLNKLGMDVIDRRNKYIADIVYMYEEYKTTLSKCEYDPEYDDCQHLAWTQPVEHYSYSLFGGTSVTTHGDMNTSTKVGDTEYNNYYVALLSRLDTQDTNNPYTKEYYELLKEIIEIRLSREKYDISMLQNEFDNLFHEIVNKYFRSPFNKLFYAMRTIKGDVTVADVEGWITEQQNDKQYNEYTQFAIKQMANIYMLIKNYNRYKVKTERKYTYKEGWKEIDSEGINNMFDLVKQENKKLEEFWSKVLSDYRNITIESLIEECKSIGDKVNQYAVWPCPSSLYIGGITYEHYLFGNPKGPVGEEPDEDLGIDYQTTPPEQPTSMEPPPYTQDDLNENDKDPSDTEPTPKDFRYWQRYFALATVISLPFLNCGLDIMPYVQLIPFPCIFICLTSVYIQMLDITIVFGLSIRGMYIWPIVLFVNLSNQYASILTPLIAQLKNLQSKLQAKVEALVEMPITAIADGYIKMLEEDNRRIRRENIQIRAYQTQIKIKKVKNQEKIKSDFNRVFNPKAKQTQHVIDPLDEDPENK